MGSLADRRSRFFLPFDDNRMVWRRLGRKPKRSPRQFSRFWHRQRVVCHNTRQKRFHHSTHLSRRYGPLMSFPWTITCLPQYSCQPHLVHRTAYDQAPMPKLFWGSHMILMPEQILFDVAIAMLMRKTAIRNGSELRQEYHLIQEQKPTKTWITFAVNGDFPLDFNQRSLPSSRSCRTCKFQRRI